MPRIRRLLLDVLKPHQPGVLELGRLLTAQEGLESRLSVVEVDDQTQTVQIEIKGRDIDFEQVKETIEAFGASLHSIDEVELESHADHR